VQEQLRSNQEAKELSQQLHEQEQRLTQHQQQVNDEEARLASHKLQLEVLPPLLFELSACASYLPYNSLAAHLVHPGTHLHSMSSPHTSNSNRLSATLMSQCVFCCESGASSPCKACVLTASQRLHAAALMLPLC